MTSRLKKSCLADRPLMFLTRSDLADQCISAWYLIGRTNEPPEIFRFGDGVASVVVSEDGRPKLQVYDADSFRYEAARRVRWVREVTGSKMKDVQDAYPPLPVIKAMLAKPSLALPPLKRLVTAPVFAPDGSISVRPGYCAKTASYFAAPLDWRVPEIPEMPTPDDVRGAVYLIHEMLCDFCFVAEADFAHAVALLLLPFFTPMIEGPRPLHLLDKPTPGAGAGLLTDVLLWPSFGQDVPKLTEADSEEEWRKRITAVYLAGTQAIVLDNVRRPLTSGALAAALTEAIWSDRFLGHSRMIEVPSQRIWIATGNNLQVSDELARRSIRIRQDPGVEHPERRTEFRHPDLRPWVMTHRHDLIRAALLLGRAWVVAGRPSGEPVLGRFESWSRTMGGILNVAGIPGFLANHAETGAATDVSTAWSALVELWCRQCGGNRVGVSALLDLVSPFPDLWDGLGLTSESQNGRRTQLGQSLTKMRDRVFGGWRIAKVGTRHGAAIWQLVPAVGGPWGPRGPFSPLENSVEDPVGAGRA